MKRNLLFFILVITTTHWLASCNNVDDCGEPPPCAPPMVVFNRFVFELLDADNNVNELTEEDVDAMSFESIDESESLTHNGNQLSVLLLSLNQVDFEPYSKTYTLSTPFGTDQDLTFVVTAEWQTECEFCKHYFISQIIQNSRDTLFSGNYQEELVSVVIDQ